ncbi:MAG: PAS domain S-box protein [Anaerolineae bacterium]
MASAGPADTSGSACVETDVVGVIQAVDGAASLLLGTTTVELIGRPLTTFVSTEDGPLFRERLARLMHETTPDPWVMSLCVGGNHARTVEVNATALWDSTGRRSGIRWLLQSAQTAEQPAPLLSARPIAATASQDQVRLLVQLEQQRHHAEELAAAIQAEWETLQIIIDNTQTQLAYLDAEFRHIRVNATYAHAVGQQPEDLIGAPLLDVIADPDMPAACDHVRHTGNPVSSMSHTMLRTRQATLWPTYWDWCLVPVPSSDGHTRGYVFSLLEVTDRERAKQQQERTRDRLAALVCASQHILAETSLDGLLHRVARAALDLTGATLGFASRELGPRAIQVTCSRATACGACSLSQETTDHNDVFRKLLADGALRWTHEHLTSQPLWQAVRESHLPIRGLLSAPLNDQQGLSVGFIAVSSKAGGEFDESDEALLVELATIASLGLQHVAAREDAEHRAEELSSIFAAMSDAVMVYDADGTPIRANPAAEVILGQSPIGVSCDKILALLHLRRMDGTPIDVADLPCSRALLGQTTAAERLLMTSQGQDRIVEVSSAPIHVGDFLVGSVSLWHDVTDQERTAQTLRRYAARLEGLHRIDSAVLSADCLEEIAHTALQHLYALVPFHFGGVSMFSLSGHTTRVLATLGEGNHALASAWHSPLAGDAPAQHLAAGREYLVPDTALCNPRTPVLDMAEAFGVRSSASVPLVAKGQLLGSLDLGYAHPGSPSDEQLEIIREIASQIALGIRQAELHSGDKYASHLENQVAERTAQLQESEVCFQTIFRQSTIGMAILGLDWHIVQCNPALLSLSGFSPEGLVGQSSLKLLAPEDHPLVSNCLDDLTRKAPSGDWIDARIVHRDGHQVWVNLMASLIRGSDDDPRFILVMVRDATEQRQAQAAMIQSEKLTITGRLASSLVHEINNPLQAVIGCLGLAEEALAEGGDVSRYLRVARDELQRAARIVGELRDLRPRPTQDEKRATDLRQLVDQVLILSQKQCRDRGIEVHWDHTLDAPQVSIVPERIQQVLLNLVLNAIDAMPEGGHLSLALAEAHAPDGVCVTVTDSGTGIPAEVLPSVFDPFYTTKEDGLGLGLFICRNIVRDHGGTIEATSAPGSGTTFRLWLPTG